MGVLVFLCIYKDMKYLADSSNPEMSKMNHKV